MTIHGIEPIKELKINTVDDDLYGELLTYAIPPEFELYTCEQVVNLLLEFGALVNNSAGQNGWGWSPVSTDMIERFINENT